MFSASPMFCCLFTWLEPGKKKKLPAMPMTEIVLLWLGFKALLSKAFLIDCVGHLWVFFLFLFFFWDDKQLTGVLGWKNSKKKKKKRNLWSHTLPFHTSCLSQKCLDPLISMVENYSRSAVFDDSHAVFSHSSFFTTCCTLSPSSLLAVFSRENATAAYCYSFVKYG